MHTWSPRGAVAVVVLACLSTAGCHRRSVDRGPWPVVTLTNLHPDEAHARMYSVNYQQPGLIPICTPMVIERVSQRQAVIADPRTGRRYEYIFHRSMREDIQEHLDLYFGTQCPKHVIQSLPPIDQQGIRDGRVYPGMTRQGVIFAIGYPPSHATPDLNRDVWKYWSNRFNTFDVVFANGVVQNVRQ